MAIKWIFFDLDDTLFDFAASSLKSLRALWGEEECIRRVFPSPDAFIEEYHIHNARMWQLHERGEITSAFLQPERFRLTLWPELTGGQTLEESQRLNDRYLDLLARCPAPCPGAEQLLKSLSRHYLIGVLTNGFRAVQYRKLATMGLSRYIQRTVISEEIGIQKPDVRLFRHAERATGATPDTALMIGDNPANDVQGAIDAGWHAIYYDCKSKPFESSSPLFLGKVTDLRDVPLRM